MLEILTVVRLVERTFPLYWCLIAEFVGIASEIFTISSSRIKTREFPMEIKSRSLFSMVVVLVVCSVEGSEDWENGGERSDSEESPYFFATLRRKHARVLGPVADSFSTANGTISFIAIRSGKHRRFLAPRVDRVKFENIETVRVMLGQAVEIL